MSRKDKQKKGTRATGASNRLTWILVLVLVAAFALFVAEPVWNKLTSETWKEADPEQIAMGEQLYQTNCLPCHGPGAQGQDLSAPMGGQRPDGTFFAPALNGTAHSWHHPKDVLFRIIKEGSPAKESPMRGFKDRLSDREIMAVMAYFQSLWPASIKERYAKMNH